MNFDKFVNSRIFSFFELVYRLIILNLVTVLTIILGLGIFTFMPALVALVIVVRSLKHDTDFPILRAFIISFKANYWRVFKLSWFYLLIGVILIFNTYFFYSSVIEYQQVLNLIIFYMTLILDGIFILAFINACFVRVYFPNLNNKKVFKYSFVLLRAITFQAIIIFIMIISAVFIFFVIPYVFIFIMFSSYTYFINLMIRNSYHRLVADKVSPLDVSLYLKTK